MPLQYNNGFFFNFMEGKCQQIFNKQKRITQLLSTHIGYEKYVREQRQLFYGNGFPTIR